MYFLLETCQHPGILRVLYFMQLILDIVFIIVPIGLIIMLMFDFTKAVVNNNDEGQIKSTKLVVKRIIYAIIIFAIPWIVSVIISTLGNLGIEVVSDYTICLDNVNAIKEGTQTFTYYDNLLEAEKEKEALERSIKRAKNSSSGSKASSGSAYQKAATSMIKLAQGELGQVGGDKYGGAGLPWCAIFNTWLLNNTTIDNVGTVHSLITKEGPIGGCGGACAGDMIQNFSSHSNLDFYNSKFYGGKYTPKAGDIIFFWYPSKNNNRYWDKTIEEASHADHIGIVESCSNGMVNTIEGNSSNAVRRNSYAADDDTILGYGSWYKEG